MVLYLHQIPANGLNTQVFFWTVYSFSNRLHWTLHLCLFKTVIFRDLHFQKLLGKKRYWHWDALQFEFGDESMLSSILPELTICKCSFSLSRDASAFIFLSRWIPALNILAIVSPIVLSLKIVLHCQYDFPSGQAQYCHSAHLFLKKKDSFIHHWPEIFRELKTLRWLYWICPVLLTYLAVSVFSMPLVSVSFGLHAVNSDSH